MSRPPSQPWPPRDPNNQPSQPWGGNTPNVPPSQPWRGNDPTVPPSRPWQGSPSAPVPPGIDMSRQYPPGHPWHDATPSRMPPQGPRSAPWLDALDVPTIHTPSSPYRPWPREEVGSEAFYAPPPPDGSRNSGPEPRQRRTGVIAAIVAALAIVTFGVATLVMVNSRPSSSSALAAISSPTPLLSGATDVATQTASTPAPSPTVAANTPTAVASATPAPTATAAPTATPLPPVEYDDSVVGTGPNQFNYVGSWTTDTNPSEYGGGNHYSNDPNGTVTFSFTGTRVQLLIDSAVNLGTYGISIDNGTEVDVDGYSATTAYQVPIYTSSVLTRATHTLTVKVTGKKNGASQDVYIDIDAVKVTP